MIRLAVAVAALACGAAAGAREPPGLHAALDQLSRDEKFSGAVVVRNANGVRFARGYGAADPFAGRRFTPDTPVDSGSLAKPVTAAALLILALQGRLDLDAPVRRYFPEYPHAATSVRHLLAHSAGLSGGQSAAALRGKTNAQLVAGLAGRDPDFQPGTAFAYCNYCYMALAEVIERVGGRRYLEFARERVDLPRGVTIRAPMLADWTGRAIGYRRSANGKIESADSYQDERFYGSGNLSVSASQLAQWGTAWWGPRLASVRAIATRPAIISGARSGLSWGNWYCAPVGRRCHYLGHHEGFHHMLYWNADRRISVAMVSNNSLAPVLQQRLQRAIVAFAEGRQTEARGNLQRLLVDDPIGAGSWALGSGETVTVANGGTEVAVERGDITYRAFPIGNGVRYVPGLDVYVAAEPDGRLRWLSLYRDAIATPATPRR